MPTPSHAPGRRRRRWIFRGLLVFGIVALGLIFVHRPLLSGFARLLRVDDARPSDALVVLSDASPTIRAACLYRDGMAPRVLLVAGAPVPFPDLNTTEQCRRSLIRNGVPAVAIRTIPSEGVPGELADLAERVRGELGARPIRRITVVAGSVSSARVARVFRKAMRGTGVDVRVAASGSDLYDESNWYTREGGRGCYLSELIKTLYYRLAY